MRILAAVAANLATLAVVAVAGFFAILILAGPHGGLLPDAFEKPVLLLGWLAVLVLPVWVAKSVWRRCDTHIAQT